MLVKDGVLDAMRRIQEQGLAKFIGLTGTGHASAMREVIGSGAFDTIQLPYNMLNPSAGQEMPADFTDRNYGNILVDCAQQQMGVMAIRVLAAGAILGCPPSAHTLKTPYFPLALYQSDLALSESWRNETGSGMLERAIGFVLSHAAIHTAIIGFGRPEHVIATD